MFLSALSATTPSTAPPPLPASSLLPPLPAQSLLSQFPARTLLPAVFPKLRTLPSMQAPIEVFETVIDEASDNPASLRLLSLTCREFLPRSRYHLFSCVVIRSVEQMESSSSLLDACPWLPPLVRKVVLSVQVPEDNSIPNVRLLDVVPVYLLSRLPNLRTWRMGMREYTYDRKKGPWLLLHHSALWRYQKYGGRIQNLELTGITMEDLSDFMGLLLAFTSVHSLTCSRIDFQRPKEPNSPYDSISARNMLARSLRIENLVVSVFDT